MKLPVEFRNNFSRTVPEEGDLLRISEKVVQQKIRLQVGRTSASAAGGFHAIR